MTPHASGPLPLSAPNNVTIIALVPRARTGTLVICVGAGASMDAGLPSGARLANAFCDRLASHGINLTGVDQDDLIAVSDAAVAVGSLSAVQEIAVDVAPFLSAVPSSTHHSLAVLLLEGVAAVMSTNWDTCVERAAPVGEQILGIATDTDRIAIRQKGLLKIHGCASRPDTILVTSAQLAAPPIWATTTVAASLAASKVIFVGIGDVAGYVAIRIERLVNDLGSTASIAIVSPDIEASWANSRWAELLPNLAPTDRIAMTATAFCDALLRAWANDALQGVASSAQAFGIAALTAAVGAMIEVLRSHTAERFIRWLRRSTPGIEPGTSALYSTAATEALCALAYLTQGGSIQVIPDTGPLIADRGRVDLHLTNGGDVGPKAAQSARSHVALYRAQGTLGPDEAVTIICAGHVGPLEPRRAADLVPDIVADARPGDLITGPQAGPTELVSASSILEDIAAA